MPVLFPLMLFVGHPRPTHCHVSPQVRMGMQMRYQVTAQ
jgi:hypothetical protein